MARKRKIGDMGNYVMDKEDFDAYYWCIKNNIIIAPLAQSTTHWYIELTLSGKLIRDPTMYGRTEIWKKIYEYYKYYYKKRK